jgi:hypothetical protein
MLRKMLPNIATSSDDASSEASVITNRISVVGSSRLLLAHLTVQNNQLISLTSLVACSLTWITHQIKQGGGARTFSKPGWRKASYGYLRIFTPGQYKDFEYLV